MSEKVSDKDKASRFLACITGFKKKKKVLLTRRGPDLQWG